MFLPLSVYVSLFGFMLFADILVVKLAGKGVSWGIFIFVDLGYISALKYRWRGPPYCP